MELIPPSGLEQATADIAWTVQGTELVKVVERADFAGALAYVNAVGRLAEAADHHPDIDIRWNKVTLHQSSHSMGGITDADVALARSIDALETEDH